VPIYSINPSGQLNSSGIPKPQQPRFEDFYKTAREGAANIRKAFTTPGIDNRSESAKRGSAVRQSIVNAGNQVGKWAQDLFNPPSASAFQLPSYSVDATGRLTSTNAKPNTSQNLNNYKDSAFETPDVVRGRVGGGNAGASVNWGGNNYPSSQSLFNTAPGAPTPIVTGVNSRGEVDRTQSDMYKQYALNPQGQFDRYFQSPEMDQYFGAASRGKGAPENLAAMEALAGQPTALNAPSLGTYYRAQSAAGRGNMDEIVGALGYKGTPMEQWARQNPMLAMREFGKKFPAGEQTQGPSDDAVRAAMQAGTFYPSEGSPKPFGTPVNSVPAPPEQQGFAVSAPFQEAADQTWDKINGGKMPNLPIKDRVGDFLRYNGGVLGNSGIIG
jgi:hypothetical protein